MDRLNHRLPIKRFINCDKYRITVRPERLGVMIYVIACVDGAAYTLNVCDYTNLGRAAAGCSAGVFAVLDRHPERSPVTYYSGNIGLGPEESSLQELAALDEKRSTLTQRHGRELLDGVVRRAKDAGLTAVESRQRHGNLVEALLDMEPEGRLFVLGQRHHAEQGGKRHLDHNVERAIRLAQRPVLVAAADYREPKRFVIAFL